MKALKCDIQKWRRVCAWRCATLVVIFLLMWLLNMGVQGHSQWRSNTRTLCRREASTPVGYATIVLGNASSLVNASMVRGSAIQLLTALLPLPPT